MLVIGLILAAGGVMIFVAWLTQLPDHAQFDRPPPELHRDPAGVSADNEQVLELVGELQAKLARVSRIERLRSLRRLMDEGFTGSPMDGAGLGVDIREADVAGMAAEWTLAPDAGAARRLLYLHGGGFLVGSPRSHRMVTAALSRACGAAVLAIDYRMLPEHLRKTSVRDCQAAYRWLLGHGPDGEGDAREVFVAGDSAGGNLALMLAAWARDAGVRPMNAAVAFCPNTDSSLSNPVIRQNRPTDVLLGPGFDPLLQIPRTMRLVLMAAGSGLRPRNPLLSPLFGDLRDLPPILVQASSREMLLGDAVRYVNKAASQGSPVRLQVWPEMVHVWQMFQHVLPEARQAIDEAAAFLLAHGAVPEAGKAADG